MYGVTRCLVGYSGGIAPNPTYSEMKDHTESVLVEFDRNLVDYKTILEKWKTIAAPYPTKRQYRTAIFYLNKEQENTAKEIAGDMEQVDVEPATNFFMAETRHQNFLAPI